MLIAFILLGAYFSLAQIQAFPSAMGAGAFARADIDYELYEVTNLNETGPGSLWYGLGDNRIIVFRVSGIIDIPNIISTRSFSNCIVLGQTAPSPGITIVSNGWRWNGVENVVFRYVKFRTWQCRSDINDPCGVDNIDVTGLNGNINSNIIFDHCSFAFGGDEFLSFRGDTHTTTVQNCIFSFGKTGMLAGDSDDTSRGWDFSIINNFWHTIGKRTPNPNSNGRIDVIGNVTYNILNQGMRTTGSVQLNEIGNYYKRTGGHRLNFGGGATPLVHTSNNRFGNTLTENGQDNSVIWYNWLGGPDPAPDDFVDTPFTLLNYTQTLPDGDDALSQVENRALGANAYLNNSGVPIFSLDELDTVAYDQFDTDNYFDWDDGTGNNTQGSWELIPERQWLLDNQSNFGQIENEHDQNTHNGVVPNSWIIDRGLDPVNFNPLGNELDPIYTNIEIYSFGVDEDFGNQVNAGSDVSICEGETVELTASLADSFVWSTGETTASISVSPTETTTYTVTGIHSDGSETTDEVVVNVNLLPEANAGEDETICIGTQIMLTAEGGDAYLWSTGDTSQSITVAPEITTTYTVTVYSNGCESIDSVTVFVLPIPIADAGDDQEILQGDSATLTAEGGQTYLWSTGETTQSIIVTPNTSNTYSVTVFQDGCQDTDDILVTVIEPVIVDAGEDQNVCFGESVTLTATVSPNDNGASYLWSTGETTQSITVNPEVTTTYSVSVNNALSTDSDDVSVIVNPIPIANAGEDEILCLGASVILTASGGESYQWSTGETTQSIEVAPNEDTTYSVTVSENGCEASDEVIVFVQELPTAYAGEDVMIVQGQPTTLTASGGGTYLWSTGETTQSIVVSPDVSTTYEVTVNVNGCQDSDEVTVTLMDQVAADAGEDETICIGSSVTLTASGGDTYSWNTGETTESITVSPSEDTIYTVTAIIGNESDSDSVTVFVNPLPEANAGEDITINEGDSGILTASGGDSYLWNTGETTQSINVNPIVDVTFTVTVYQNGCENTDSVNVFVNPAAEANAGDDIAICNGEQTTLTATGGDLYLWSTGETTQSINVAPTNTTNYSVIVSNDFSSDTDEVTVFVNPLPELEVSGDVSILKGEFVTLSASGANTYEWSNGAVLPNIAVSPMETTTYFVTGFINNCSDTKEVTVSVFDEVVASAGSDVSICAGESTMLTASGGDNYLWSNGEITQSIEVSPLEDTLYTVIVTNELDSDTDSVEVLVSQCVTEEINLDFDYQIYLTSGNPNELNISLSGLDGDAAILMHDLTGKLLYTESFDDNNGSSFIRKLNVGGYSKSIYLITLEEQGRKITKKVVFN